MHVEIQDLSPVEKQLKVEIPWERVREKLDAAYRELSRGVTLKGFRPGKVPRSVLERMFGKKVQLEVAKDLVQESFLAAAREHKLEPVAEPVVEDAAIRTGEAFRYSARVEVRSPVEVKEWEGLPGARRKVEVAEDEVRHALEHRRLGHTEYRAIEGRTITATSDVLVVAAKGRVGEFPVDKPELMIDLGHTDHEPLPGLAAALTGIPLDTADREITLAIPAEHEEKEIAGKTATLKITIRDAREKIVPALDDDFAKDTGEADTLAELTEKLRARLLADKREQAEHELRDALLKELVKRNPVQVAPALVERGIDSQVQRARLRLAMQGIDIEKAGVDLRAMRERLRDSAADEIRGQLLLDALADAQGLDVSDAELDQKIVEIAKAREKPAHKVKAELDREGSLESLRWRLRQEKALDLVVSRATITESAEPAKES